MSQRTQPQPTRRPPTQIPTHRTTHDAEIIDDMDELLRDIDDILEQEDEFLTQYRQKPGE